MGEEAKQEQAAAPQAAEEANKKPAEEQKPQEQEQPPAPEEKKAEENNPPPPPSEEAQAQAQEQPPPPPEPLVLYVDLHCVGCAKKIERSILKIRGVEGVTVDMGKNQVTIKGVVEPQAVCDMVTRRTKRQAKVISPLPKAEGEPLPEVVTSQVSGLITVELNVNMHCDACANQLKKKILKMRGVQSAETELSSGKVVVKGTMDADKLVDYVYRRTRKQATIVPQPEPEKPPQEEPPKPEDEQKQKPPPAAEEGKPAGEEKKEDSPKDGDQKAEEGAKEGGGNPVQDEHQQQHMMRYYHGGVGPGIPFDHGHMMMMRRPPPPPPPPPMYYHGGGFGGPFEDRRPPMMHPYGVGGGGGFGYGMPVEEDNMNMMMVKRPVTSMYHHSYQPHNYYMIDRNPPPAPQLFSDENPNACCIS